MSNWVSALAAVDVVKLRLYCKGQKEARQALESALREGKISSLHHGRPLSQKGRCADPEMWENRGNWFLGGEENKHWRKHWFGSLVQELEVDRADLEQWLRQLEQSEGGSSKIKTGKPGRPTAKPLILAEHERRVKAGEAVTGNKAEEARKLRTWFVVNHPNGKPPEAKTIANWLSPKALQRRKPKQQISRKPNL